MGSRLHTNPIYPTQSSGAAVLSGTGNLRENPAAFPCQENAPLLPHCQCKALCRQPAGRGPRPESLPEQGEQGKATCELLLGPVQGQGWAVMILVGSFQLRIFRDSLILPGKGSTCWLLCQAFQGLLQPSTAEGTGGSVPTQHTSDMEYPQAHPRAGCESQSTVELCHRRCSGRKTHTAHRETEALSVCAGWAQSLHCRLLPWDLACKKMGFLPPEHIPLGRQG